MIFIVREIYHGYEYQVKFNLSKFDFYSMNVSLKIRTKIKIRYTHISFVINYTTVVRQQI